MKPRYVITFRLPRTHGGVNSVVSYMQFKLSGYSLEATPEKASLFTTISAALDQVKHLPPLFFGELGVARVDETPGVRTVTITQRRHIDATKPCVIATNLAGTTFLSAGNAISPLADATVFSDLNDALTVLQARVRDKGIITTFNAKVFNVEVGTSKPTYTVTEPV